MLNPHADAYSEALGAELHRVGGDRDVRLADQLRVVAVGERHRHPRQRREPGRRGEAGVEAADGEGEAADAGHPAERRRAGEREAAAQLGVDEHGVEGGRAGAEVEHADGVEVELHDPDLVGREHRAEPAEHDQPVSTRRRRTARMNARSSRTSCVRPNVSLTRMPTSVLSALRREERGQRLHDLGRVVHRVGREQQVLQLAGRERGAHRVLVERAVRREQHAEPVDGDRTDLPPEPFDRADDDERRTRCAVGVLRGDEPERLQRAGSCRGAARARRSRCPSPGRGRSLPPPDTSDVSTCTAMPSGGLIPNRASTKRRLRSRRACWCRARGRARAGRAGSRPGRSWR